MLRRRTAIALASLVFASTGCSAAQVQSWFSSRGLPAVSDQWATLIAGVVDQVQSAVPPGCPTPSTTSTTTTEAPTTTVAVQTAFVHHNPGRHLEHCRSVV